MNEVGDVGVGCSSCSFRGCHNDVLSVEREDVCVGPNCISMTRSVWCFECVAFRVRRVSSAWRDERSIMTKWVSCSRSGRAR